MGQMLVIEFTPRPDPGPWPDIVAGGVVLGAAAAIAFFRARRQDGPPPRRLHRIAASAAAFGLALSMSHNIVQSARGFGWGVVDLPGIAFLGIVGVAIVLALFGATMLGTADLLVDALRPRRTPGWLVLSPPLLTGFVVGLLMATGFEGGVIAPAPGWPALAIAAAAASLVWWSFLPRKHDDIAWIFR